MVVDKEILRKLEGLAPFSGDIDIVPSAYKKRLAGVENWEQYAPIVAMEPLKVSEEQHYRRALTETEKGEQVEKMREIVSEKVASISNLLDTNGEIVSPASVDNLCTEVVAELYLELGYRAGVMPRTTPDDA